MEEITFQCQLKGKGSGYLTITEEALFYSTNRNWVQDPKAIILFQNFVNIHIAKKPSIDKRTGAQIGKIRIETTNEIFDFLFKEPDLNTHDIAKTIKKFAREYKESHVPLPKVHYEEEEIPENSTPNSLLRIRFLKQFPQIRPIYKKFLEEGLSKEEFWNACPIPQEFSQEFFQNLQKPIDESSQANFKLLLDNNPNLKSSLEEWIQNGKSEADFWADFSRRVSTNDTFPQFQKEINIFDELDIKQHKKKTIIIKQNFEDLDDESVRGTFFSEQCEISNNINTLNEESEFLLLKSNSLPNNETTENEQKTIDMNNEKDHINQENKSSQEKKSSQENKSSQQIIDNSDLENSNKPPNFEEIWITQTHNMIDIFSSFNNKELKCDFVSGEPVIDIIKETSYDLSSCVQFTDTSMMRAYDIPKNFLSELRDFTIQSQFVMRLFWRTYLQCKSYQEDCEELNQNKKRLERYINSLRQCNNTIQDIIKSMTAKQRKVMEQPYSHISSMLDQIFKIYE